MASNHKSPGISKALQYSLLIIAGIILTVILLILELPMWPCLRDHFRIFIFHLYHSTDVSHLQIKISSCN